MREITISKVKLISGGDDGVEIQYEEDALIKSNDARECENPVHDDFKNAVQGLAVHLAILTDYLPEKKSNDEDAIAKFTVTGYSVKGSDEKRGFVITGHMATKRGGTVILNTPFTRFEEDEATAYALVGDVESKIKTIEGEGKQYLFKGKQAPKKQLSLDMPEDQVVNKIKVAEPLGAGKKDHADPDAMKRVAAETNEELNGKSDPSTGKRKNADKKK